ncbi:hypothetical protein FTX61_11420 [Nitriliruptoraceae bacterium ZYF776]|nr:hypothetical protein [Profundirhabdus halotolerans]
MSRTAIGARSFGRSRGRHLDRCRRRTWVPRRGPGCGRIRARRTARRGPYAARRWYALARPRPPRLLAARAGRREGASG